MEKTIAAIGIGVSEHAQAVFDALERTMPCEWRGRAIHVYGGEVRVAPPYGTRDAAFLEGAAGNEMMLQRVRTVLDEEFGGKGEGEGDADGEEAAAPGTPEAAAGSRHCLPFSRGPRALS